jgi:hypothetical protein
MAPKVSHSTPKIVWQKADTLEEKEPPKQPSRLRTILSRAAVLYLSLFLGLSTLLMMAGIDPLTHNGALPKWLLVYVGLATILALANSGEASLLEEHTRAWLAVFSPRSRNDR